METLPVAPPPEPRKLTEEELRRMDRQREAVLRELRVFLRDATNKLLAERKFKEFVNPVNPEEVCVCVCVCVCDVIVYHLLLHVGSRLL